MLRKVFGIRPAFAERNDRSECMAFPEAQQDLVAEVFGVGDMVDQENAVDGMPQCGNLLLQALTGVL
jgi:hypothetical protein